jgi:hypothetical protein
MESPLENWKKSKTPDNDNKIYHKGGIKKRKVWLVQHENFQPIIFSNPTTALEYGREELAKRTNNYDGTRYIDPQASLCIVGYYINDIESPAFVLTSNLFNEELVLNNNQLYDSRQEKLSQSQRAEIPS